MSLSFVILYVSEQRYQKGEQTVEILRCENVRKVYGSGNNQVVALDHIDLSVQKGEFVAIVGRPVRENPPCCTFWAVWISRRRETF